MTICLFVVVVLPLGVIIALHFDLGLGLKIVVSSYYKDGLNCYCGYIFLCF